MKPNYNEKARKDLRRMDENLARDFITHAKKIANMPPRRHLEHGLPYNVDQIGGGRLVYEYNGKQVYIVRCFDTHKKYMNWLKSFR